jgi:phenylalanyl-tRNA synthetase alpha chain
MANFRPKLRHFSTLKSPIKAQLESYKTDEFSNVPSQILSKLDKKIYLKASNPINILTKRIEEYFKSYTIVKNLNPIVTPVQNFDELLFAKNHPGRAKGDTYYINKDLLLRTHTSAHQLQTLKSGQNNKYLIIADCYRRDEVDKTHYPIFHQMEGLKLFSTEEIISDRQDKLVYDINELQKSQLHSEDSVDKISADLKQTLIGLMKHLFGPDIKTRWARDSFPFTSPSWELEVFYNNEWMEVLGCGIIKQQILTSAGLENKVGWAFGMGLERLAMVLFKIPDIRLFWSDDSRFLEQFKNENCVFKSYSKYPVCYKDVSFWCGDKFQLNDFYEACREVCGDLCEKVELIDEFNKNGKVSRCFRVNYRSMDSNLTNQEVDVLHADLVRLIARTLDITIR